MGTEELSQRDEPLECKVCGSSEVECGTGEGRGRKTGIEVLRRSVIYH